MALIPYSVQVRPNRWVTLILPADLTQADIDRVIEFLHRLGAPQ